MKLFSQRNSYLRNVILKTIVQPSSLTLRICLALVGSVMAYSGYGQVPTISSFTPASGKPGAVITIKGSNFSSTVANNKVFFGTIKAKVNTASPTQLTVEVPAGVAQSKIGVVVNNLWAISTVAFNPTFATSNVISSSAFGFNYDLTNSGTVSTVAIGDLDGDGLNDVVATIDAGKISLFRNKGTTDLLNQFSNAFTLTTEPSTENLIFQDLNGDAKPEIITTASRKLVIFENLSSVGSFSFSSAIIVPLADRIFNFTVADLDGDGRPDIVTSLLDQSKIGLLRNLSTNGKLTSSSFASPVFYDCASGAGEIIVSDFDGDGHSDLAVSSGNYFITVFRNNMTSAGNFSTSSLSRASVTTAYGNTDLASGDFNNDGKADLVALHAIDKALSVHLFTGTTGDIQAGSFSTAFTIATSDGPTELQVTDLDGDGNLDIATVNATAKSISIFRNEKPSSFSTDAFPAKVDFATTYAPWSVAFADLTNDGRPEMIYGSNVYVSMHKNQNNPILPPVITDFNPKKGTFGTVITIEGENFSPTPSDNVVYFNGIPGVVKSSTTTELVVDFPTEGSSGKLRVDVDGLNGIKSVTSTDIFVLTQPPAIFDFTPYTGDIGTLVTVTGENFSSNAQENIVFVGTMRAVVKTASPTTLTVIVPPGATSNVLKVSVKGLSCRSRQIFTTTFDETGPLSDQSFVKSATVAGEGMDIDQLFSADLDNDGDIDIVSVNSVLSGDKTTGPLSVWPNVGKGVFGKPITVIEDYHQNPHTLTLDDINEDGLIDIVYSNYDDDRVVVLRNVSSSGGAISFVEEIRITLPEGPYGVAVADLDDDGRSDIVASDYYKLRVFRNTSTHEAMSFAAPLNLDISALRSSLIIFADIDGDHKLEIIADDLLKPDDTWGSVVSIFRNTSRKGVLDENSFASAYKLNAGVSPFYLATTDFNHDQKPDLVISTASGQLVSVVENKSTPGQIDASSFGAPVKITTGSAYSSPMVLPADMDGDGNPDLVAAHYESFKNYIRVFKNVNTAHLSNASFEAAPQVFAQSNTFVTTLGDFDGDGRVDVARRNGGELIIFRNVCPMKPSPSIEEIPVAAAPGDTIVVRGQNFPVNGESITVEINGITGTVIANSDSTITFIVPAESTNGKVIVSFDDRSFSSRSDLTIEDVVLATEEAVGASISVYPNPSSTVLNIAINGGADWIASITVHDNTGRVAIREYMHSSSISVDVSDLKPGLYVVTASTGRELIRTKFVKR